MSIAVRWCSPCGLDVRTRAAWSELGQHARHPSPFLLPQFIVPAAHWLTPERPPRIALFERCTPGGRQFTYTAGRNEHTGHADLAWALFHALHNEPLEGQTVANTGIMEIY